MPVLLPGKSHGQRSLEDYIQSIGPQRIGRGRSDLACTYVQRSKAPGPTPRRAKLALNAETPGQRAVSYNCPEEARISHWI